MMKHRLRSRLFASCLALAAVLILPSLAIACSCGPDCQCGASCQCSGPGGTPVFAASMPSFAALGVTSGSQLMQPFTINPTLITPGLDIQFDSLTSLGQIAIVDTRVGLTAANVSRNVGDVTVRWGPILQEGPGAPPGQEHPHMQMYLYRQLPGGATEIIGHSDIKHFFATTDSPDNRALHPGNTDPYGTFLNSDQTLFSPITEIDPVTLGVPAHQHFGFLNENGVYQRQNHPHDDRIEHLLQAEIADLDPGQNPDETRWFLAGRLFVVGDGNTFNNDIWYEIFPTRNAAGNFSFTQGARNFGLPPGVAEVIPEPSTLTLLGVGALSLGGYLWRRRRRA